MRRALKFLTQGILSYVVAAAFIAVVEHAYLKRSRRRFVR